MHAPLMHLHLRRLTLMQAPPSAPLVAGWTCRQSACRVGCSALSPARCRRLRLFCAGRPLTCSAIGSVSSGCSALQC